MDTSAELLAAFKEIESERGIDRESLFEAIEASLLTACKKNYGPTHNIKVHMDRETGRIQVYAQKNVVESVTDSAQEIALDEARAINPLYNTGDVADIAVTPRNFGRISAQSAKQVVMQKIREAERNILYKEYKEKEREVVTGIVQRFDKRNILISLGKIEAMMPAGEQTPGERYVFGDRVKVYVLDVKDTSKGPLVNVSRTHPELVKRLFENEVPEIYDGTVEIKSISREAGSRTKMAVYSKNPNVEAVGACVGQNGYRVNVVVRELNGEKIDIINWSAEPRQFISAALSPSKTLAVVIDEETRGAKIVVPDYQLSLAIGKEGQNARLAAKLTGFKIDIKSESQARATDFIHEDDYFREGEPESFTVPVLREIVFEEAGPEVIEPIADIAEAEAEALVEAPAEEPAAAVNETVVYADEYYDEYEGEYAEDYYDDEYGEFYEDEYYDFDENPESAEK
ncbi:MAG: transcription termination factor NusA [Defluviitaleaceae bacterium]|nr:transcription termination factor NusA [Defluviitaleaceae bacterium]MCL2837437.1 transcription termination factor NusA [Defluviitaleaceae bacterium]